MAARFNKVARCVLSKADMEYLDSMDPAARKERAHTTLVEVWPNFLVFLVSRDNELILVIVEAIEDDV